MGSSHPNGKNHKETAKFGEIYFKLDRMSYKPGDTVSGNIYVKLLQPYPGNKLYLRFKGKEHACLVFREKKTDFPHNYIYHDKINIAGDWNGMMVYEWEVMKAGELVIPFSFILPSNLPPSFYQEGWCYFAAVIYQLIVEIYPNDEKFPRFKYRQQMIIREDVEKIPSNLSHHLETKLTCCCCFPNGSNSLRVSLEKNCFVPGETVNISLEFLNSKSDVANKKIVVALKQRLFIKAYFNRKMLYTFTKIQKELKGVKSHDLKASLSIDLPQFLTKEQVTVNIKTVQAGDLTRLKENNNALTSTTKGSIMYSEYFFEISCPMEGCCSGTPKLEIPFGLCYPNTQVPVVTVPECWNPEIIPRVNLVFPLTGEKPNTNPMQDNVMLDGQILQNNTFPIANYN